MSTLLIQNHPKCDSGDLFRALEGLGSKKSISLLGGKLFSCRPEVYLFEEGLVRLATQKYNCTDESRSMQTELWLAQG